MKLLKALLFIVPAIFMLLTMLVIPEIADLTSPFFVALMGVFLGVDMVAMIKRTKEMQPGEFQKMKVWRVVVVTVSLVVLLATAFIQYKSSKIMVVTVTSFAAAVYLLAGIILAGLDANRIATKDKVE